MLSRGRSTWAHRHRGAEGAHSERDQWTQRNVRQKPACVADSSACLSGVPLASSARVRLVALCLPSLRSVFLLLCLSDLWLLLCERLQFDLERVRQQHRLQHILALEEIRVAAAAGFFLGGALRLLLLGFASAGLLRLRRHSEESWGRSGGERGARRDWSGGREKGWGDVSCESSRGGQRWALCGCRGSR